MLFSISDWLSTEWVIHFHGRNTPTKAKHGKFAGTRRENPAAQIATLFTFAQCADFPESLLQYRFNLAVAGRRFISGAVQKLPFQVYSVFAYSGTGAPHIRRFSS